MPRFFIDGVPGERVFLTGENALHISRSLRMSVGEELLLCDGLGTDYRAVIEQVDGESVVAAIKDSCPSAGEPKTRITIFQGLPKGDKMDWIVQKCVELGADRIVPVLTRRSISQPDEKSIKKKTERWQKIAVEAAKQSQRGALPQVAPLVSFTAALDSFGEFDQVLVFYEGGGTALSKLLTAPCDRIAVFIGPEGGFEAEEIVQLNSRGARTATLGPRILRTETAPIAVMSILMYAFGEM